ncbi:MAG: hypothetical protein Kow0079_00480 [Vicingaceae bacterium]
MELDYRFFPDESKVWVYTSNKPFDEDDINYLNVRLDEFIDSWESHGKLLKATYTIEYNHFIILFVDEEGDRMCGRAQDAQVKLMKEIEQELEIELLNRLNLPYKVGDKVEVVDMNIFTQKLQKGEINENTIVFNNMITRKLEFDNNWEVPLKDSWHKQLMETVS